MTRTSRACIWGRVMEIDVFELPFSEDELGQMLQLGASCIIFQNKIQKLFS